MFAGLVEAAPASPSPAQPRLPPASAPPPPPPAAQPSTQQQVTPRPVPPPASVSPSPVPPTAEAASQPPVDPGGNGPPSDALGPPRVVITRDTTAAESDHDAVVGAWGIEVRPVASTLPVFARRASTGCPLGMTLAGAVAECPPVAVSALGVRHWLGRNLAVNAGVALAMGGGSEAGRLLDSYFGFGPVVGVSVLLGNWRHLAIAASPNLLVVVWKPAGSADSTYVADLRADLEGELHLGFIGVPALSLGIRSGVLLRLEHAGDVSLWSAGVSGATSLRGLVSDLHLRYYF